MKRAWIWLLMCSLGAAGGAAILPLVWTPLIATEASVVTMAKPAPPQIEPDDTDLGQGVGGPLDSIRDAKELVRKGNELADRGKALLDQAERNGKITVDIHLPGSEPKGATCESESAITNSCSTSSGRTVRYSPRRPLLFWRWRR
jgi:hypothetical protein